MTSVSSGQLPKWVTDEIQRSTPKDRRDPAIKELSQGVDEYADERYPAALPHLRKAKTLSPKSSVIRELLGLASYRSGKWDEALAELRTFRRMTGDLIHMPIEIDCLRALGRKSDVTREWEKLRTFDISATIDHEARVVYASFLLDEGRPRDAWPVIKPGRLVAEPSPGELRRWFVAARVALAAGDKEAAGKIVDALEKHELEFEGVDELRSALN
jgi:tetratricopeptide (TPR) repeat protein